MDINETMPLKITILYDNRCDNCQLQEGWGFSAFIEYGGCKILFDTGGDALAFSSNFEKMQLSYRGITHLLLSHWHWDHRTGVKAVIKKLGRDATLCLPKRFPWWLLKRAGSHLKEIKVIRSFEEIAPNIYSLVLKGGFWLYEQSVVLKTPNGLGIITACAHPGIVQIVKAAQEYTGEEICFVMGGFHQFYTPAQQSIEIVKQLQQLKVQKVAPCHCSGDHLIRQFQEAFGPNYLKIGTGTVVNFENCNNHAKNSTWE